MRALPIGLAATALLAPMVFDAPCARALDFCGAVKTAAAGAASGFATLRGAQDVAAHTSSFDVYSARQSLPGAKACSVTVPGGAGLGPPTYGCDFAGTGDLAQRMSRLTARVAQCVGVAIPDPPPFRNQASGPEFAFNAQAVRYEVSASRADGASGPWVVSLQIGPAPLSGR